MRSTARSGWWVVVGGSVLLTLQNGLIISAFGAYLVVITDDTGWSPGVIALGYAIVQLGNGFLSPLTGWFCDRVGVRAVARAGTVVTAAGFAVAAAVADASHFVGAVVVIALGCSAAGITPLTVAVVQTMTDRRTLALGLLPTGIALGGLAVPVVTWALAGAGWRATFVGVAVAILAVGLVASAALPADRRPRPVGVSAAPRRPGDHDLGSALRTAAFWLLVVGHGTALVAVSAVSLHLVPLMTHHGIPLATAGLTVAVMSTAQLIGQVVTGLIADRLDKRRLAAACMVVQTCVLVGFATVSGFGLLMATAIVHGFAWGLRGPVMTALRADYFGVGSFGTIMGWSAGFVSIGLVVGPLLVTAVAGGTGGYPAAFLVLAAVTAAGAIAFVVLRRPRGPVPGLARPRCDEAGDGARRS
ncbi:putative MFS family arabinose efflux permease [Pseudonocardia hierapolitana]|uniref:Putative MFS family arabinose efflux permease n=1 Tax=Pseudonocardia hierapolitana TaxID=1128676 RepID=A0A561T0J1_9PSEU|nr:MFS transporter [Pseudonocardia hierapolitana]TWF80605.1 putative MFS family arabinose efflux permease [Pseudonocardia hierapolitana]